MICGERVPEGAAKGDKSGKLDVDFRQRGPRSEMLNVCVDIGEDSLLLQEGVSGTCTTLEEQGRDPAEV